MPRGWKWIVPDLRGHGETRADLAPAHDGRLHRRPRDALWNHLGIERSHLVGYSMGGRLALHVAARRPERILSLLTIGAHAGLDEDARERRRRGDEALAERIERDGLEAFVQLLGVACPCSPASSAADPLSSRQAARGATEQPRRRPRRSLRGMGAGAMEPLWDELDAVDLPCTFVAGQLDHGYVASARRLAKTVPARRVESSAGAVTRCTRSGPTRSLDPRLSPRLRRADRQPSSSTTA